MPDLLTVVVIGILGISALSVLMDGIVAAVRAWRCQGREEQSP